MSQVQFVAFVLEAAMKVSECLHNAASLGVLQTPQRTVDGLEQRAPPGEAGHSLGAWHAIDVNQGLERAMSVEVQSIGIQA